MIPHSCAVLLKAAKLLHELLCDSLLAPRQRTAVSFTEAGASKVTAGKPLKAAADNDRKPATEEQV